MKALLQIEFYKLLKRNRTYISFALLAVLIGLLYTGLILEGENLVDFVIASVTRQFVLEGNILNGYFIPFLTLGSLFIHIPILIVIVTGDILSSEMENGTSRLYLSRPITRNAWLLSKFAIAIFFVIVFMLFLASIAVLPGILFFGKGDIIVLFQGFEVIEQSEVPLRFIGALSFATLAMATFGVFTVALSVFVKRSLSTILITLGVLIISTLLQNFAPGVFESWKPFLFTYHMSQWQLFFFSEIPVSEITTSAIWLFLFSGVSIIISLIAFRKMNILE